MQGTMTSNLSLGRPVIVQMNRLRYDAVAVGNHEFDWGVDILRERVEESEFPYLGANFYPRGKNRPVDWVESHTMVRRRGVDVAVLGFCTVSTPTTTLPDNVIDYEFPPAPPIAQEIVEDVRDDGAEVVVLISHIGARQDSLWGSDHRRARRSRLGGRGRGRRSRRPHPQRAPLPGWLDACPGTGGRTDGRSVASISSSTGAPDESSTRVRV